MCRFAPSNISATTGSVSKTENNIKRPRLTRRVDTAIPLPSASSGSISRLVTGSIAAGTVAMITGAPQNDERQE